jgi:hypothetical protein
VANVRTRHVIFKYESVVAASKLTARDVVIRNLARG